MKTSIAIVVSVFNAEITEKLLEGAISYLREKDLTDIKIVKVPGAIEIPLVAKLLAKKKCYEAIICLGAVIRGETDHYQYVCQQVSAGCQEVMLTSETPVIFGVLTTDNEEQAEERAGGSAGHKGREAAEAALHMIAVMKTLQ